MIEGEDSAEHKLIPERFLYSHQYTQGKQINMY